MEIANEKSSMGRRYYALDVSPWPVNWSAIFVGSLAGIATAVCLGLIGTAIGAHQIGASSEMSLKALGFGALAYTVLSTLFSFGVGGWVAGRITGFRRTPEATSLHGAIVWLLSVPVISLLVTLGAGASLGAWYSGLGSAPSLSAPSQRAETRFSVEAPRDSFSPRVSVTPDTSVDEATTLDEEEAAAAARNAAASTLTILLLGLIGAVLGGWMAAGGETGAYSDRVSRQKPVSRVAIT